MHYLMFLVSILLILHIPPDSIAQYEEGNSDVKGVNTTIIQGVISSSPFFDFLSSAILDILEKTQKSLSGNGGFPQLDGKSLQDTLRPYTPVLQEAGGNILKVLWNMVFGTSGSTASSGSTIDVLLFTALLSMTLSAAL